MEPTIAKLKIILSLVVGAILMVGGLGVASLYGFSPFKDSPTDAKALVTSIQNLSQYHAAVGSFEVIVDEKEEGLPLVPEFLSGRRTLLVTAGTVNAYVDLSDLTEEDLVLSDDGRSVQVRLPEPQLDKPNLDHSKTQRYDLERGVIERIADASTLPEESKYYKAAEAKMAESAETSELRDRAADNTKAAVIGVFSSLGMQVSFLE